MIRLLTLVLGISVLGAASAGGPADALPKEVLINNVEFVQIPAGWVIHPIPDINPRTGASRGKRNWRDVKVWTDTYYLAKYEARARDFIRFMRDGSPRHATDYDAPPTHLSGSGAADGCAVRKTGEGAYFLVDPEKDLPVTHLSWQLADEFSRWMGFRLPTEAEWVRAFRGDDKRIFPWGDEYPDDTFAGFQEGATLCNVRPVTSFPKGRSPFGVYNMAGNVFEYVADWFNAVHYDQLRDGARNPVALSPHVLEGDPKPYKVLRGGRWASGISELTIYGNRDLRAAGEPFICFGARFAVDAEKVRELLKSGVATHLAN